MPLPPNQAILDRFVLLEQSLDQEGLSTEFQSLVKAPSTPELLREYFTLLDGKKAIEREYSDKVKQGEEPSLADYELRLNTIINVGVNTLFLLQEEKNPQLTALCQAHWAVNANFKKDGTLALRAEDADPQTNKKEAEPLIEELKTMSIGIAYRFQGDLAEDNEVKIRSYQQAAETGDLVAKGLVGNNYQTDLLRVATSDERSNAPSPSSTMLTSPHDHMREALYTKEPHAVANNLIFLNQVCDTIKSLTPQENQKSEGTQLLRDKKLISLLKSAKQINNDPILTDFIDDAIVAIDKEKYGEAHAITENMQNYIKNTFQEEQIKQVKETINKSITKAVEQAPTTDEIIKSREKLNPLYDLYQGEITRMQSKSKLSASEAIYVEKLQKTQKDLVRISNLDSLKDADEEFANHSETANKVLQTVPHPYAFMRVIENLFNTIKQRRNPNADYSSVGAYKARKEIQSFFKDKTQEAQKHFKEQLKDIEGAGEQAENMEKSANKLG